MAPYSYGPRGEGVGEGVTAAKRRTKTPCPSACAHVHMHVPAPACLLACLDLPSCLHTCACMPGTLYEGVLEVRGRTHGSSCTCRHTCTCACQDLHACMHAIALRFDAQVHGMVHCAAACPSWRTLLRACLALACKQLSCASVWLSLPHYLPISLP